MKTPSVFITDACVFVRDARLLVTGIIMRNAVIITARVIMTSDKALTRTFAFSGSAVTAMVPGRL
jgi:hypothetical protein